nr:hypothetical protein LVJ77_07200 [Conchiformibius kuhniae]
MKAKILMLSVALLGASLPALVAAPKQKDTVVREFTAASGDGNNGWRAVVKGNRMALETVRNSLYYPNLRVQRSAYAKGVEFTAKTPHGEAVLNIRGTSVAATTTAR